VGMGRKVMRSKGRPAKTARASASCAPLQMLMQTGSDVRSASTIRRKVGSTRSNEPGKLIPSRRGHESQVAACGSHSAGIRNPSEAGVLLMKSVGLSTKHQNPSSKQIPIIKSQNSGEMRNLEL